MLEMHLSCLQKIEKMEAIKEYLLSIKEIQGTPNAIKYIDTFMELATTCGPPHFEKSISLSEQEFCNSQRCFENCQNIASRYSDMRYFEGYVSHSIITEHAWLIDNEGDVLDPTVVVNPHLIKDVSGYIGVEIPHEYIADDLFDEVRWESLLEKYISEKYLK